MKKILKKGRNCWKISEATQSGLLVDARAYYRAFYRAARSARNYIAISGWQFDSNVSLLRGSDAEDAAGDGPLLLAFLNELCGRNPDLRVFILAWDFSFIYSFDREWFLQWYVSLTACCNLKFCFDHTAVYDASHHQKFVVIDGRIAFVGGLDLCSSRWDDRDHQVENPWRVNTDGTLYRSFHDIQSYQAGPIARDFGELFKSRWKIASGEDLEFGTVPHGEVPDLAPTLPLPARQVAISRTQQSVVWGGEKSFLEIRQLFLDAIAAAENLVYIENQYFSSEALYNALLQRMADKKRSPLEIVLMIAKDAEGALEQLSIGVAQERIIQRLRQVAQDTGHHIGIYYPTSLAGEAELATYIHSKLLLVDDRFLSVGSANMNNRSMGYDTEVNVSWEAGAPNSELARAISAVRIDLLAEHTGLTGAAARDVLAPTRDLVARLDRLANDPTTRLRHHPLESVAPEYRWVVTFLPDGLPFDSERSEESYEAMSNVGGESFFSRGIASLKNWLFSTTTPSSSESGGRD
jgi:phospholipase D1/2